MKKQLLRVLSLTAGVLALSACSSEYDFESKHNTETEREKTYNEIFVAAFGEPDAYHSWGFGSSSETRSAYPNGNQWAAQGYSVPDPLSAGQKLRVQYYFQMVQYPGGTPDNGQIDFFMQQVYDGGTDPMSGKSPEQYLAANGSSYIQSGEHMDHLTAGSDNEHVNNFNNGNCGAYANVLDNGGDINNGPWHSDQIMLMQNTKTDCFGYANSDASYVRTDRWRLVSYEVIDAFCDDAANGYETWRAANHSDIADAKVTDTWKRSFIGFDFDMIPDNTIFAGVKHYSSDWTKIESIDYTYMSIWLGSEFKGIDGKYYVWNGTELIDASTIGEITDESEGGITWYPYMPGTTQKIHMLVAETNQYCGESETWTEADWGSHSYNTGTTDANGNAIYKQAKDLTKMYDRLSKGYLRTSDSDKKWIKVGNCADGYYSDWIVSFMPATGTTPAYYSRRVIAEDLGTAENTDFDYNDVVFDVVQDEANTTVTLRAAGGTLPLYLVVFKEGTTIDEETYSFDPSDSNIEWSQEVHAWYDVPTSTMVNTNNGTVSKDVPTPKVFTRLIKAGDVHIFVNKGGFYTITARVGRPAQKLAVGTDFPWLDERVSIIDQTYYGNFLKYVKNEKVYGDDSYKLWYNENPEEVDETLDGQHQGTIGL